jgi:serine/threonine protein kinase
MIAGIELEEQLAELPMLEAGDVVVPGFVVIEHLHRSRHFDVYDVFSEERGCRCIAKLPMPDRTANPKIVGRLLREGALLRQLTHPHIVRVYDIFSEPRPALILETLTGETLAHLIDDSPRRLPLTDIAHLGLHLCAAIHYLHRHNILHLDLKPSNIVAERQMAKVLDLSLARPPGPGKRGVGTLQYLAPEQARGDDFTPAADVWGIGAVLFEATTAEYPFHRNYASEEHPDVYEQTERRIESVRVHRRVPSEFARIVDGCLEPDPEQRPTVSELVGRLNHFVKQAESNRGINRCRSR